MGPIHVVLDIFLTGPHDLYRAVDVLRDFDSANYTVNLQTTTEAATEEMIVDDDLIQR
jgi:hypothetical protein